MKKNYQRHIFDVGAFNGTDGIALALKKSNIMVHAFEANPEMIKKIRLLKNKIKNFENINYKNSVEEAISSINLQENDIILITGSLYLAGEVLNLN